MTREQMIDELVQSHIDAIFECGPDIWIENALRHGATFKPYDQLSDKEIAKEYEETFEEGEA